MKDANATQADGSFLWNPGDKSCWWGYQVWQVICVMLILVNEVLPWFRQQRRDVLNLCRRKVRNEVQYHVHEHWSVKPRQNGGIVVRWWFPMKLKIPGGCYGVCRMEWCAIPTIPDNVETLHPRLFYRWQGGDKNLRPAVHAFQWRITWIPYWKAVSGRYGSKLRSGGYLAKPTWFS